MTKVMLAVFIQTFIFSRGHQLKKRLAWLSMWAVFHFSYTQTPHIALSGLLSAPKAETQRLNQPTD